MSTTDRSRAIWRKSTRSASTGNCVEVADLGDDIWMRDSKNPTGPALEFTAAEFAAFIGGVKDGEFDLT